MAEIGMARAGSENQRVIGDSVAILEQHALFVCVDAVHTGEQRRDLLAVAQEMADRPGDFGGGERGGRDLIQQRLEQMMVAAVDQRDLDGCALQAEGCFQPAKAGADDDHAMGFGRRRGHGGQPSVRYLSRLCSHFAAAIQGGFAYRAIVSAYRKYSPADRILRASLNVMEMRRPSVTDGESDETNL